MERTKYTGLLKSRIAERRRFIQVLAGPRQVGKTTILSDVVGKLSINYMNVSTDDMDDSGDRWLTRQWSLARNLASIHGESLLVVDEIQQIPNWSRLVKRFWDEDTRLENNVKVVLSGSSRLFLMKGLSESLMGRFELITVPHWSYAEIKEVFGFNLDEFIYFGAYPGAASLYEDENRWRTYIKSSIVEPSITKDILMLTPIHKPALLRQLMDLGSSYSGQILPYDHMLGQLTDAGNTTTLANYLVLLRQSGLIAGLEKYSGIEVRKRASSPKLQVFNNALFSCAHRTSFAAARKDPTFWGRLVESAVGAHLINSIPADSISLGYWREGPDEVDFVISDDKDIAAFEVKSGNRVHGKGMDLFLKRYPDARVYSVSAQGAPGSALIPLEKFLLSDPVTYLG